MIYFLIIAGATFTLLAMRQAWNRSFKKLPEHAAGLRRIIFTLIHTIPAMGIMIWAAYRWLAPHARKRVPQAYRFTHVNATRAMTLVGQVRRRGDGPGEGGDGGGQDRTEPEAMPAQPPPVQPRSQPVPPPPPEPVISGPGRAGLYPVLNLTGIHHDGGLNDADRFPDHTYGQCSPVVCGEPTAGEPGSLAQRFAGPHVPPPDGTPPNSPPQTPWKFREEAPPPPPGGPFPPPGRPTIAYPPPNGQPAGPPPPPPPPGEQNFPLPPVDPYTAHGLALPDGPVAGQAAYAFGVLCTFFRDAEHEHSEAFKEFLACVCAGFLDLADAITDWGDHLAEGIHLPPSVVAMGTRLAENQGESSDHSMAIYTQFLTIFGTVLDWRAEDPVEHRIPDGPEAGPGWLTPEGGS